MGAAAPFAPAQSVVILRRERSEPRRMGHGPYSSFEARKSAHLRMTGGRANAPLKQKRPGLSTRPLQTSIRRCSLRSARLLHEYRLADLLLDRALQIERAGGEYVGL